MGRETAPFIMAIEEQDIIKWYDDWHRRHQHNAWRGPDSYVSLVDLLKAEKGQRLLDLGCGTGFFLKAASDAGLETHGVDISSVAVALSKQVSPTSTMHVCSMENLNGIGLFDYVTAFGSMEHCLDINKALSEVIRVLEPSGRFVIMVPNNDYDGPQMSIQEEIKETRKTLKEWSGLFESAGFTIDDIGEDMVMHVPEVPIDKTYQFIFTLSKEVA